MEHGMAPRSFGKRAAPARAANAAPRRAEHDAAPPDSIRWTDTPDTELEDWKRGRRYRLPWRQISFTASLCFGIAALVLPDSVNGVVDWLLYGMAAASFVNSLRKQRT
jgi:hypothetical protein